MLRAFAILTRVCVVESWWGPWVGHILSFIAGSHWKYLNLKQVSKHQVPSPVFCCQSLCAYLLNHVERSVCDQTRLFSSNFFDGINLSSLPSQIRFVSETAPKGHKEFHPASIFHRNASTDRILVYHNLHIPSSNFLTNMSDILHA